MLQHEKLDKRRRGSGEKSEAGVGGGRRYTNAQIHSRLNLYTAKSEHVKRSDEEKFINTLSSANERIISFLLSFFVWLLDIAVVWNKFAVSDVAI